MRFGAQEVGEVSFECLFKDIGILSSKPVNLFCYISCIQLRIWDVWMEVTTYRGPQL